MNSGSSSREQTKSCWSEGRETAEDLLASAPRRLPRGLDLTRGCKPYILGMTDSGSRLVLRSKLVWLCLVTLAVLGGAAGLAFSWGPIEAPRGAVDVASEPTALEAAFDRELGDIEAGVIR